MPGENLLLGLLRHSSQAAQRSGLSGPPEILQGLDAQLLVKLLDRPGTDAGNLQQRHQARRYLIAQTVVEGEAAGPGQLVDLRGDRVADAGDAGRIALAVGSRDLDRRVGDRVGGPMVGDGLEDELALDLEHVADLVEDAGQLAIGERRRSGITVVHRPNGSRGPSPYRDWLGRRSAIPMAAGGRPPALPVPCPSLLGYVRIPGLNDAVPARALCGVEGPVRPLHDAVYRLARIMTRRHSH